MNRTASRCEAVKKTARTYTCKRSKERRRRRRRRWNQIENYISKGRRAGVESKPWEQIHLTASSRLSQMLCATFFLAVLYRRLYGKTGEEDKKKKRKENQIKIRFSLLYSIRSHSWLSVCRPSSVQFANHWKPFFFLSFFSLQIAKLSSKNVEKSLEVVFSHFLTCFNSHFFSFEVKEL